MKRKFSGWPNLILKIIRHPANKNHSLKSLGRTIAWRIYEAFFTKPVKIQAIGYSVWAIPKTNWIRQAFRYNFRPDFSEMVFLENYLRPGDSFLDVGANIGFYSLHVAPLVGPSGRVDAFEPAPATISRFQSNIVLNGFQQIHLFPYAVGSQAGKVKFLISRDSGNRIARDEPTSDCMEVSVVRLDDALPIKDYAAGKMDLEGAEPLAFQGAVELLKARKPPVWTVEVNRKIFDFGWTPKAFGDWLRSYGYSWALFDIEKKQFSLIGEIEDRITSDPGRSNFFLLAVDRLDWIHDRLVEYPNKKSAGN